jgi:hypothetical protein
MTIGVINFLPRLKGKKMTNRHLKSAKELACLISLETNQDKKRHLIKAWSQAMIDYMDATAYARAAHV